VGVYRAREYKRRTLKLSTESGVRKRGRRGAGGDHAEKNYELVYLVQSFEED